MIKYLICLLLGHDIETIKIDRDPVKVYEYKDFTTGYHCEKYAVREKTICRRCSKYRKG